MRFLYIFFIELLRFGMFIGSFFSDKLKKGWEGRKQSFSKVKNTISKKDRVIWMHASSLGEYEQGLPVLSQLKKEYPTHKILVTFFSPSGYENIIHKKHIADVICYLPFDRKSEVKRFLDLMNVQLFFTVKYDYWYHLLDELKGRKTKVFIVSALFYSKQIFFSSWGKYFVKKLNQSVDWFFHQTEESLQLAQSIGLAKSSISGDTRYDRVKENFRNNEEVPFIKEFIGNEKVVVFGSSWEPEEKVVTLLSEKMEGKMIIAPHDLKRIIKLKEVFPNAILYSQIEKEKSFSEAKILLIDSIGLLSKLYAYADISVVGGGFDVAGLHNILESAVFGNPVLFGNKYENHPEADDLIVAGGAMSFATEEYLVKVVLDLLKHDEKRLKMAENAKQFIIYQSNSSDIILDKIRKWF